MREGAQEGGAVVQEVVVDSGVEEVVGEEVVEEVSRDVDVSLL